MEGANLNTGNEVKVNQKEKELEDRVKYFEDAVFQAQKWIDILSIGKSFNNSKDILKFNEGISTNLQILEIHKDELKKAKDDLNEYKIELSNNN